MLLEFILMLFIPLDFFWPNELHYLDQPSVGTTKTGENFLIINENGYIRFYNDSYDGQFTDHYKILPTAFAYYCVINNTIYTSDSRSLFMYDQINNTFTKIFDFNLDISGMERLNNEYILAYTRSDVLVIAVNKKELNRIEMVNVYQDEVIAKKTTNFALFATEAISLETVVTKDGKSSVRLNFYEPKFQIPNFLY
jgi:hypothetical protein